MVGGGVVVAIIRKVEPEIRRLMTVELSGAVFFIA
jgi:hypothetical protein